MNLYTALRQMEQSNIPFSVVYRKYSRTRKTGGQLVQLDNVVCAGQPKTKLRRFLINFEDEFGEFHRVYIHTLMYYNGKKLTI